MECSFFKTFSVLCHNRVENGKASLLYLYATEKVEFFFFKSFSVLRVIILWKMVKLIGPFRSLCHDYLKSLGGPKRRNPKRDQSMKVIRFS